MEENKSRGLRKRASLIIEKNKRNIIATQPKASKKNFPRLSGKCKDKHHCVHKAPKENLIIKNPTAHAREMMKNIGEYYWPFFRRRVIRKSSKVVIVPNSCSYSHALVAATRGTLSMSTSSNVRTLLAPRPIFYSPGLRTFQGTLNLNERQIIQLQFLSKGNKK